MIEFGAPGGAEIGALERIDGDIHLRIKSVPVARRDAHFLADEKHRRFIALAFADHDRPVHAHVFHLMPHRLHRDVVGFVRVAQAHRARRSDSRLFHHAKKFKTERPFHVLS